MIKIKKSNTRRNIIIPFVVFLLLVVIVLLVRFIINFGKYKIFVFNNSDFILYQESNKEWFNISESEFLKKYKDKSYILYVDGARKGTFEFNVIDKKLEMIDKSNNVITRYTNDNYF